MASLVRRRGGRVCAAAALLAVLAARCGGAGSPVQPTPPATTAAVASTPFSIDLPIRSEDSVSMGYGLWPFGVHGSAHAVDGHPGFDFEFRPGTSILAAAGGVVDNAIVDSFDPTKTSLQLRHHGPQGDYFTSYSNLASVPQELRTTWTAVARGQIVGVGGVFLGGASGMTHFGVYEPPSMESPSGGAVSPANYTTSSARAALDAIWRSAVYNTEWCEPFLTNSRAAGFPLQGLWTRQTGGLSAQIPVRCPADGAPVLYSLADGSGEFETGTLRFSSTPAALRARVEFLMRDLVAPVIAEEFTDGREFMVALLATSPCEWTVLPIEEVTFAGYPPEHPRILTYAAKWLPNSVAYRGSAVSWPDLAPALVGRLRDVATAAARAVGLRDYGRVDVRMRDDGTVFVLEVNPNPDIGPESGFIATARVAGLSYEEVVTTIVRRAVERGAAAAVRA